MIPKMTSGGYGLMIRALTEEGIQFSRLKFGNGSKPDDYVSLEDLQNPIMSVELTEISRMEQYVLLEGTVTNAKIDSGFDWTEMGVFATNPDGGDDILYAYAHCEFEPEEKPIPIPANTSGILELTHRVYVYVGEIDNVTAILAQSAEYASKASFDSHIKGYNNPHKVTKEHIGLGNVPNVTPENQCPIFDNTYVKIEANDDGRIEFSNIASGDIMGVILRKIRTAIYVLLNHLNGKNPHKLTPKDINAASSSHYHAATDIRTGTLTIPRGGTGASTAPEARTALGIQAGTTDAYASMGDGFPAKEDILLTTQFPVAFSNPPIVTVTLVDMNGCSNTDHIISVEQVTAKEFTVRVYSDSVILGVQFNWIAVG